MQNNKAESYRSGKYQDKQTKEKPYHDNHRPPPRFRTVLNTKRKIITQTKIPKRNSAETTAEIRRRSGGETAAEDAEELRQNIYHNVTPLKSKNSY